MTRRSQHERSADTTARLLDATVDLLHDRGLARMSTSDIAARAGVSRGALTHHFDSREAIVAAAVARQLGACTAALHDMAARIRETGGTTDDIVDHLWRMMSDRLFYVTMEYLPEARHNPEFRRRILPVVREFHDGLNAVWAELAGQAGIEVGRALVLMNATLCMMRGMIAQTAVKEEPSYFATLLDFWKGQLRREIPPVAPPARRPLAASVP